MIGKEKDPVSFDGIIDIKQYVKPILTPYFIHWRRERVRAHFTQDNAATHKTNNSMNVLADVLDELAINQGSWLAAEPVSIVTFIYEAKFETNVQCE